MGQTEQLARRLQTLKVRTDRSYEALARRVGVSRSNLHRYCRGEVVPTPDVVVRFAGLRCDEAGDRGPVAVLGTRGRPAPAATDPLVARSSRAPRKSE